MPARHWGRFSTNGRITIPAEIRRNLGMRKGDLLLVEATDGGILLAPSHLDAAAEQEETGARSNECEKRDDHS